MRDPQQFCLTYIASFCLQKSGLSDWLGDKLTPLQYVPPAATVIILCLLVAVFTECTSNVATTTLFLPILASMVSWLSSLLRAVLLTVLYTLLVRVAGLTLLSYMERTS